MFSHHFWFRKREVDRAKALIEKKRQNAIKKHDNTNHAFKLNEECEQKLVLLKKAKKKKDKKGPKGKKGRAKEKKEIDRVRRSMMTKVTINNVEEKENA